MNIEHHLDCAALGRVRVHVPSSWPRDYGFIVIAGEIGPKPLVRIQSRCSYGEVFGSTNCDCKQQLDQSCELIRAEGGLLFYLDQEGRGGGSLAKARAYQAREQRQINTFDFYEEIGLPADLRQYGPIADALLGMGIDEIRLITGNPTKVEPLEERGIKVERIGLEIVASVGNAEYLAAKRARGYLQ